MKRNFASEPPGESLPDSRVSLHGSYAGYPAPGDSLSLSLNIYIYIYHGFSLFCYCELELSEHEQTLEQVTG